VKEPRGKPREKVPAKKLMGGDSKKSRVGVHLGALKLDELVRIKFLSEMVRGTSRRGIQFLARPPLACPVRNRQTRHYS
jgi:hypothetical protein